MLPQDMHRPGPFSFFKIVPDDTIRRKLPEPGYGSFSKHPASD